MSDGCERILSPFTGRKKRRASNKTREIAYCNLRNLVEILLKLCYSGSPFTQDKHKNFVNLIII